MEGKELAVISVVLVAAVVLSGAALAVSLSDNDKDEGDYVFTFYVGLQNPITHTEYDRDEAIGIIDGIVLQYTGGLTHYDAKGTYTYDNALATESTLVYVVAGLTVDDAHAIADKIKASLSQDSVMITYEKQNLEFY